MVDGTTGNDLRFGKTISSAILPIDENTYKFVWNWPNCIKQSSISGEFWFWICLAIFNIITAFLYNYLWLLVSFRTSCLDGGSLIFCMWHVFWYSACFLVGSWYRSVFQPAHICIFEKRLPAIIQRISMFEYVGYGTNRQTLLLEKLSWKEISTRFKVRYLEVE